MIIKKQKWRSYMPTTIKWNDRFNLGVESIDKAHQKLFSIVEKMVNLNDDEKNRQWICEEGIKYFKSYALKHFADEEAYMQTIHYIGYSTHKRIHDNMRNNTLPALEKDMVESGFSVDSVQHFLGICIGWLSAHIMLEDRAIVKNVTNKWIHEWTEDASVFEETAIRVMNELFVLKTEIVSEHYTGENFGKRIGYRLMYRDESGKLTQVLFIFEEKLILFFINRLIKVKLTRLNKVVIDAVGQIAQQFMKRMAIYYSFSDVNRLEKCNLLTEDQLNNEFRTAYPKYSMLFNTGMGYFALCIKS